MAQETWQEQLRRGGLDLAILATLARGPGYGLSIIRDLEARSRLVLTEGTVYPILGRLAREKLLDAEWVNDEAPHPRKYYRITTKGRAVLAEMSDYWRGFSESVSRLLREAQGGRS